MTIYYYYLFCKDVANSSLSSSLSSSTNNSNESSAWSSQLRSITSTTTNMTRNSYYKKRIDSLRLTSVGDYNIFISTIYFMMEYEMLWWMNSNVESYKATQSFVYPRRLISLIPQQQQQQNQNPSTTTWSLLIQEEVSKYIQEFSNRVLPPLIDHQLTVLVMYIINEVLLSLIIVSSSEEICLKLTQHPFYASESIMDGSSSSSSSSLQTQQLSPDRITGAMEIISISLWSNSIWFVSHYIVNRLKAIYYIKKKQRKQQLLMRERRRQNQQQTSSSSSSSRRTINASGREVVVIVVDDDNDDDQDNDGQDHQNNNNLRATTTTTTTTDILLMDRYWNLSIGSFWIESWNMACETFSRYIYSSFGSGLSTIMFGRGVATGWGSLIGIGIGDFYYGAISSSSSSSSLQQQQQSTTSTTTTTSTTAISTNHHHHHPFTKSISLLRDLCNEMLIRLGFLKKKDEKSDKHSNNNNDDDNSNKSQYALTTTSSKKEELLTCGCCQIVTFSSDASSTTTTTDTTSGDNDNSNNNNKRLPISSRVCDHTICKNCVEQCQIALMERTSNYEEYIKCPLCNASKAFNCYDHLINRSLCNAILLIEENEKKEKERMMMKTEEENDKKKKKTNDDEDDDDNDDASNNDTGE